MLASLNTYPSFSYDPQHSQVETAIRNFRDPHIRWSTQGMLRLSTDAMKRLFTPTLENIKVAIGDVLNNPKVKGKLEDQMGYEFTLMLDLL